MHLESLTAFLTHLSLRLEVTWASDSRPFSTPSLPLNGIWQLRVSNLSVGLHTKSTLNTFVVQLYLHRVILILFHKLPELGWFHQHRGGLLSISLVARFLVTVNCSLVPLGLRILLRQVIFSRLSKTILVMASYDSGHPSLESYWAWVVPSESPYTSTLLCLESYQGHTLFLEISHIGTSFISFAFRTSDLGVNSHAMSIILMPFAWSFWLGR